MKKITIFLLILALPTKSYPYCFESASEKYRVHPTLLWAIAKVESNFHPYAIAYRENRKNKSIYPDSIILAKRWIDWLWQKGLDFDLGVGQINRGNIIAYKINPYSLLDPCYNLNWSAYILRTMIDRFGYTWEGISRYNGGGLSYAWNVWKVIEGLELRQ
jgi:hypothetical protein